MSSTFSLNNCSTIPELICSTNFFSTFFPVCRVHFYSIQSILLTPLWVIQLHSKCTIKPKKHRKTFFHVLFSRSWAKLCNNIPTHFVLNILCFANANPCPLLHCFVKTFIYLLYSLLNHYLYKSITTETRHTFCLHNIYSCNVIDFVTYSRPSTPICICFIYILLYELFER